MPCFLSQVLILDEPASGLDPLARRDAWELLRSYRKGRTILLSTHYVQEADYIFDRVAFMVDGRLRCCGTPTALKQQYGYVVALISTYTVTLSEPFSTRSSDRAQIWHACADIDETGSYQNNLTHPTPGGFRGLSIVWL